VRNSSCEQLRHLDAFAGIGGFPLAAERVGGIQTVGFIELAPDAQQVLRTHWPQIPIAGDIRNYQATPGECDLLTAGFPCTGTSEATRAVTPAQAAVPLLRVLEIEREIKAAEAA
jgi:site-specific DNA-cytosine methylase